ncbi:hypothetical protein [Granulicella sp. dw_53]|uniref:hypothetical protein n=1 Tax=Granulicella sp. dw_53 TaxID=2719792 RepID=UPI001BD1CC16|nr:hypothetical protein [Granulicella sp. dw_53]
MRNVNRPPFCGTSALEIDRPFDGLPLVLAFTGGVACSVDMFLLEKPQIAAEQSYQLKLTASNNLHGLC